MRTVLGGVKPKLLDPAFKDPSVLTCAQVEGVVDAAREQEVVGLQTRGLDPFLNGVSGRGRDLELDGSLRLVLHHDSPRSDLVTVTDVADLEHNGVASAQFAVDA
jgi:hypothetical protein